MSASRYQEMYKDKLTDVEGALSLIKSGDVLAHGATPNAPNLFLSKLHTVAARAKDITVYSNMNFFPHEFLVNPAYKDVFTVEGNFLGVIDRKSYQAGIMSYIPGHLFDSWPKVLANKPNNVFVCQVSPMDHCGYFQSSMSLALERECADMAKTIILEVNHNMPRVIGDSQIHISDVTAVYEHDSALPTIPRMEPDEDDLKIASSVASLIKDGDTLQVGIGSMPDAMLRMLTDKNDLGLHTEMFTSTMADLVKAGNINGKRKSINKGHSIGVFVIGDGELYEYVTGNPHFMLRSPLYVNDPRVISQNDNMVAVNTTLAMDLTGQIASESLGHIQYSGQGGQYCYAQGAGWAKNGRFIIAFKSTAKNGAISTITPTLPRGAVVSVMRAEADYIITEYGTVRLKGLSVRRRAEALISIAHPKFRDELTKEAKDCLYM